MRTLCACLLSVLTLAAGPPPIRVFIFARTDCPITNRYAPELQRIAAEFAKRGVEFSMVYPDPDETPQRIAAHMAEYKLPGNGLRDPKHDLARRAQATISPQAAVFDKAGQLVYSGRIDDRYVDFGKARQVPTTHDLEAAIQAMLDGKPVRQARTHAVGCYLADVK
jgi:AhpC/TSA family